MPSVGEGPLLNVARVAKAVGLTEATIRRWALEGLVPGVVRLGRTIRFDPAAIDAWLALGRTAIHTRPPNTVAPPIPANRRTVAETVGTIHQLGAARQGFLDQLAADLAEARAVGDDQLVSELTEALEWQTLARTPRRPE